MYYKLKIMEQDNIYTQFKNYDLTYDEKVKILLNNFLFTYLKSEEENKIFERFINNGNNRIYKLLKYNNLYIIKLPVFEYEKIAYYVNEELTFEEIKEKLDHNFKVFLYSFADSSTEEEIKYRVKIIQ